MAFTAPVTGLGHSTNATAGNSTNATTSDSTNTTTMLGPNNIPITIHCISNTIWPSDLMLDIQLANWDKWSFQVTQFITRQGL